METGLGVRGGLKIKKVEKTPSTTDGKGPRHIFATGVTRREQKGHVGR